MEDSAIENDEVLSISDQHTIGAFVKQNVELIQAVALFAGSTVLAQIFDRTIYSDFIVTILLGITILLFLELRRGLPPGMKFPLTVDDILDYMECSREYYALEPTHFLPRLRLFSLLLDALIVSLVIGSIAAGGQLIANISFVVLVTTLTLILWSFLLSPDDVIIKQYEKRNRYDMAERYKRARQNVRSYVLFSGLFSYFVVVLVTFVPLGIAYFYFNAPWYPNLTPGHMFLGLISLVVVFYLKGSPPTPIATLQSDLKRRMIEKQAREQGRTNLSPHTAENENSSEVEDTQQ